MKYMNICITGFLALFCTAKATTWYVHPDSILNSIQTALWQCATNDTILVGAGIYHENLSWPLCQGIDLISEHGADTTVIDGDSSGTVITMITNTDSTTLINGFTVTNGFATDGGGLRLANSNPILSEMIISNNTASEGGGIYCHNSRPQLLNTTITWNLAKPSSSSGTGSGGGIYCTGNSDLHLTDIALTFNTAEPGALGGDGRGGGICCNNSSLNLTNVTISDNTAEGFNALGCGGDGSGGGIYCCNNSNLMLNDVMVNDNWAMHTGCHGVTRGGGIYCNNSVLSLLNSTLSRNTTVAVWQASAEGGGIYCAGSNLSLLNVMISENTAEVLLVIIAFGGGISCNNSSLDLRNCIISGNSSEDGGGGMHCNNCSPYIENVTMSDNTAVSGGAVYCGNPDPASPIILNCILWNNMPQEIYIYSGSITSTYSDIQGGWPGTGNINADPMFTNGPLSNYHLSTGSPCIDAGNPATQYNDPEDPLNPGYALWPALGTLRNDMGAYGGPSALGWTGIEEYDQPKKQLISHAVQIYPNPFRNTAKIRFSIQNSNIRIYDASGRMVKSFNLGSSIHNQESEVIWDGTDQLNRRLPSGVYFVNFSTEKQSETRKVLLVR
jgi:hypothetical protein